MAKKGHIPWNKGKHGVQEAWNKGLTKETDERVAKNAEATKETKNQEDWKNSFSEHTKELWQDESYRQSHIDSMHTDEYREKISNTSKRMWNNQHDKQLKAIREGWIKNNSLKKLSQTFKDKWNTESYRQKRIKTFRLHNSFNRSLMEDDYYNTLVEKYGQDNVIRQYSDNRYPSMCDFYIKSNDLFIEYNLHWTHGEHPFDKNNIEDMKKAIEWCDKDNTYYDNALFTWCKRDVIKYETAIQNNINYEFVYPKNIVYSH